MHGWPAWSPSWLRWLCISCRSSSGCTVLSCDLRNESIKLCKSFVRRASRLSTFWQWRFHFHFWYRWKLVVPTKAAQSLSDKGRSFSGLLCNRLGLCLSWLWGGFCHWLGCIGHRFWLGSAARGPFNDGRRLGRLRFWSGVGCWWWCLVLVVVCHA